MYDLLLTISNTQQYLIISVCEYKISDGKKQNVAQIIIQIFANKLLLYF